ncbi:MAG: hypothetical protein PUF11_09420 [Parafannyhessea umbonata]|uniref:hypothetical protein n=1 Tax=Parafannyhessea umbonata TaxID=604330 RepID=UPI0026EADD9B|nr:hypothetical protein [Parafannyhessea umbonata]MDD6566984.1 hypothetical protein [Parafannyhessea umbonata]
MITNGTFLMYETSDGKYTFDSSSATKWSVLMPITEYPDLDAESDGVENTTLSNGRTTYEPGLPDDGGSLAFPGYYSEADRKRINELKGKVIHCAVVFKDATAELGETDIDPTGGNIVSEFNARPLLRITGASSGDVTPVELDLYTTADAKTYPASA